ncbi:uncharacterized protein BDR25DRAFT_352210 [Lindgomyces ingoldianus]|uniref:Uncharacterized protein n=1 Tax=Lindgomyces ingoldianus TaxID=673940 RepID=A0ACB6R3J5_9PLEO|nr:uncharacterized protein BDR25DRAFT_352210 [Lindgomyces ingoldianus]KAF2473711.1 hypothetical protein BDR25DRAFT_352210 [Lindgomyces ingoldianus]
MKAWGGKSTLLDRGYDAAVEEGGFRPRKFAPPSAFASPLDEMSPIVKASIHFSLLHIIRIFPQHGHPSTCSPSIVLPRSHHSLFPLRLTTKGCSPTLFTRQCSCRRDFTPDANMIGPEEVSQVNTGATLAHHTIKYREILRERSLLLLDYHVARILFKSIATNSHASPPCLSASSSTFVTRCFHSPFTKRLGDMDESGDDEKYNKLGQYHGPIHSINRRPLDLHYQSKDLPFPYNLKHFYASWVLAEVVTAGILTSLTLAALVDDLERTGLLKHVCGKISKTETLELYE